MRPPVHELSVLAPPADAVLFAGAAAEVRWAAPPFLSAASFQLDLFSAANKSRPLVRVANGLPGDSDSFLWTVPHLEPAKVYYLRLLAFPGNGSKPRFALSEQYFAIGGLSVAAPERPVVAGSVARVELDAAGWGALLPLTVELLDLRPVSRGQISGSQSETDLQRILVAENQSPGTTEVHWSIPFTLPEGCHYVYRVSGMSEQDFERTGVPDQLVNATSDPFCISRPPSTSSFRLQSPSPSNELIPGAELHVSFSYRGTPLSSWNLDIHCSNASAPCFLGIPLARDQPMTRTSASIPLPPDLEAGTFHFLRIWGFPLHRRDGSPADGTSRLLWACTANPWPSASFRNPLILIRGPSSEDKWTKSLPASVEWTVRNAVLESYTVELHCYDLASTLVATIEAGVENTRLEAAWKVPSGLPSSSRYAVRIWGRQAAFVGTAQRGDRTEEELVEAVGQLFTIESWSEADGRRKLASAHARTPSWSSISVAFVTLLYFWRL
ncbi:hypothetical protein DFJ74DRAFT_196632 [Hyaloraphidium curvatum]|nr:hypothetical protein DFJ74DRAFT_196632 [Hyaloraphidium curvatum]